MLFIVNGEYGNLGYSIVLFVALLLLFLTGLMDVLSKLRKIKVFKDGTGQLVIGHISMMLGVCALIAVAMNNNGVEFSSAVGVMGVLIVFTLVMLFMLLKIYTMLNSMAEDMNSNDEKESE